MGKTSIEWTDETWNPVTGCDKVSAGCRHCYAERIAERFRGTAAFPGGFDLQLRPERLEQPLRWRKPRTVFVNSMSDLFHEGVPDAFIRRVFEVMAQADRHRFQVLTKRHRRLEALAPELTWLGNVWMGVSVESSRWLSRVKALRTVPAAVRFLSCEPLLGPLNLDLDGIDWVIAGGESGPGARPMQPAWPLAIRDQCLASRVPFFFKQWGAFGADGRRVGRKRAGRRLEGRTWDEMPFG